MKLLASSFLLLALGPPATEVPDCRIGDTRCLETLPVLGCAFDDDASAGQCRAAMESLAQKSRAGWRDATRMLALAHHARADRHGATAEAAREDRERSLSLYRGLVESDPDDAESIFGLAAAVDDEAERIRLLRRYVALVPDAAFGRRFLAQALYDGAAGSQGAALEAGQLMEEAYALETGTHRWWLARNAAWYYEQAGRQDLATALRARVIRDLGVTDLTDETLAGDVHEVSRVLSTVCNTYLVEAAGAGQCLLNLGRADAYLSGSAPGEHAQRLADVAAEAMVGAARADSGLCPDFTGRLQRMAARGFGSPAVHAAQELLRQLEGTITVE